MLTDLLKPDLPVLIQGVTGRIGRRHAAMMRAAGTNVVAGVSSSPKGDLDIPVFATCAEAVRETGARCAVALVPPFSAHAAAVEAIEAGITLIVTPTEGMPVHDALKAARLAKMHGVSWVGPSTPGVAAPGRMKLGFLPDASILPGRIGVMSKSGTLSYEVCYRLKGLGIGQSLWIGVGGDPVKGVRFPDAAVLFQNDPGTDAIIVIGEIGGTEEEDLAAAILAHRIDKPVFVLLAGATAPNGVTMGHAGAMIHGKVGTVESKRRALEKVGAHVFFDIAEVVAAIARSAGHRPT